jgi:Ca2+-binding RTX toxin-like protein
MVRVMFRSKQASKQSRTRRAGCAFMIGWLAISQAAVADVVLLGTNASETIDVSTSTEPHEIYGKGGSDVIRGSQAADRLFGESGADQIHGNAGNDRLSGGSGNDLLYGGEGDDVFEYAGARNGSDTIDGGSGTDRIAGSAGDDVIGVRALTGVERIDGSGGNDVLQLQNSPGLVLDLSAVVVNGIALIAGGSSADVIRGSAADDRIQGGPRNDSISGGPGRDVAVYVGPSADYVVTMSGGKGTVRALVSTEGTDTLESIEVLSFADGDIGDGDAFHSLLAAAPEGSWLKVNLNRFSDVWTPTTQRTGPQSYQNPARIILAWSSMAWDSNRRQLIFWGGGHGNYAGNEVYRFDAISQLWERASLPSDVVAPLGDAQYFAVDGPMNAPIAAHTYDNQEFLPLSDRFITFGGGKFNCCAKFVLLDGVTPTGPYLWDPSRAGADMVGGTTGSQVSPLLFPDVIGGNMWQNRNSVAVNGSGSPRPSNFVNGTTAYAEYNGKDSVLIGEKPTDGGRLFRYTINDVADPTQDQWQLVGVPGKLSYADQGAGAYDSLRQLFVRTAKGSNGPVLVAWSLESPGPTNSSVQVTLAEASGTFGLNRDHGIDYDSVRGVFALWDGSSDVWYVTPPAAFGSSGWSVTRASTSGGASAPTKDSGSFTSGSGIVTTSRGILGKWKYARQYDVFLGVEDPVNGDVWVYKPANWQPLPAP